jgi:hypothetical protein
MDDMKKTFIEAGVEPVGGTTSSLMPSSRKRRQNGARSFAKPTDPGVEFADDFRRRTSWCSET